MWEIVPIITWLIMRILSVHLDLIPVLVNLLWDIIIATRIAVIMANNLQKYLE